jgi:hypothetical protein
MDNDIAAQVSIAARLNDGEFFGNHPSHNFNGLDGRCADCDCRPFGRHAPHPCEVW